MKWPNDVLIEDTVDGTPVRPGKVAGVLTEVTTGGAVVIGIGLNVTTRLAELPDERATSLALAGARTHRPRDDLESHPAVAVAGVCELAG